MEGYCVEANWQGLIGFGMSLKNILLKGEGRKWQKAKLIQTRRTEFASLPFLLVTVREIVVRILLRESLLTSTRQV
jgi:hypothetical protein